VAAELRAMKVRRFMTEMGLDGRTAAWDHAAVRWKV